MKPTFRALLKEADFTKEMLSSGATQIRSANYASKGIYFQAFVSLSTGLERIGKLSLILDHYIKTGGSFPDLNYMKKNIGHKLGLLYEKSQEIVKERSLRFKYAQILNDPILLAILGVLHDFAEGDRYANINYFVGSAQSEDPIARWFGEIDLPIFENRVSVQRKAQVLKNAETVAEMSRSWAVVFHSSETGRNIEDIHEASVRTGIFESVSPYRQLYVLQIIRYWVELLGLLEGPARAIGKEEIPFFGELFAHFYNDDSFFRSRKTW